DIGSADDIGSVHQPDAGRPVIVLPQDVGLAVAVEIARAFDVPGGAGIGADIDGRGGRGPVHQPDAGLTVVVLPKDVGLAVAVEIAGALDMPRSTRIGADIGAGDG